MLPPAYQAKPQSGTEPLLNQASSSTPGNAFYDQPDSDIPDDFKYGTTVSDSAAEIRSAFVRKVYTILFCQLLATTVVGGTLSRSPDAIFWVQSNTWSLYVALIGTMVNLFLLYWKRHSHPANLIFLSTFTVLEAATLGFIVAFYDTTIVLQALLITLGIFLGLTLFTLQSKWDFSGMAPFLFGGLIALLMTGIVGIFIPFSKTFDLIYAIGGSLLFSGYVVFDTYMIFNRLSADEFILGAISLYLDFINLFLNILRVLNNVNSD